MGKKPFRGAIRNWYFTGGRIHGECVAYNGDEPSIVEGSLMTTSEIVMIVHRNGYAQCETKNSRYILV